MPTRRCHHCGENVDVGAPHDCWTTMPEALTRALPGRTKDLEVCFFLGREVKKR